MTAKNDISRLEDALLTAAKGVFNQREFKEQNRSDEDFTGSFFSRCGFSVALGVKMKNDKDKSGVLVKIEYPGHVEFDRDFYPRFTGYGQDWKAPAAINIFFKEMDKTAKEHGGVTRLKGVYPRPNQSYVGSPEIAVEYIVSLKEE